METRRQRRPPPGDVEHPVQDEHVVALDHLAQQFAACRPRDLHVQLHVPPVHGEAQRRILAALREAGELPIEGARAPLERPALGRRRPLREQSRRLRLEGLPELVEMPHVGVGRHAHARPGPGPRFEEAILLEPAQRFRHGQDAHPQLESDTPSRHRRAGPELALQDVLADREVGAVGEAAGLGRRCPSPGVARPSDPSVQRPTLDHVQSSMLVQLTFQSRSTDISTAVRQLHVANIIRRGPVRRRTGCRSGDTTSHASSLERRLHVSEVPGDDLHPAALP